MKRVVSFFLFVFTVTALADPLGASIAYLYGFGPKSSGMAGAFTAVADDAAAVYYNPAGLMFQRQPARYKMGRGFQIESGLVGVWPRFYTQNRGGSKSTQVVGDLTAAMVGITLEPFDFSGALSRKCVSFGFGLMSPLPSGWVWRTQYPQDRIFALHHDYNEHVTLIPAMAWEVIPGLSVGFGLNIMINVYTETYGQVLVRLEDLDTSQGDSIFGTVDVKSADNQLGQFANITLNYAPIIGLMAAPAPWIRVGLTYRKDIFFDDPGENIIVLNIMSGSETVDELLDLIDLGVIAADFSSRFIRYYIPNQVSAGAALLVDEPWVGEDLTVTLDVTWMDWSGYMPQLVTPVTLEKGFFDPDLDDTVVPRVGLEWTVHRLLKVRGGYAYQPTPVPAYRGAFNLLDNDRHVVSTGFEVGFDTITIEAFFQYHHAVERTIDKDPGYGPDYRAGGHILGAGAAVTAAF